MISSPVLRQKTYAVVGTGGRCGGMFLQPLVQEYAPFSKLVAFCDVSRIRMNYWVEELEPLAPGIRELPLYQAEDFDLLLAEQQPDVVIVCSMDSTHAHYIVKSLEAGCDVIVEKPMATTVEQLKAIGAAATRSGKRVHVAFNYRWMPFCTKVREILQQGAVGSVMHIHFEYRLDTKHGADYFRRWHARMENSGGLLVHKATHHFDLVNWWLDSIPQSVCAHGALRFYGKENAVARGDERLTRYPRYTGEDSRDDPFRLDLLGDGKSRLYYAAEKDSGYVRDRNVFREDIDIYDTMSLTARYRSGSFLTYSLVAYAPAEGFRVTFTGDRGRLELEVQQPSHLILGQSDKELAAEQSRLPAGGRACRIALQKHFAEAEEIHVEKREGGHMGADPQIRDQFFHPEPVPDHAGRLAGWEQGAVSVLLGLAANQSIETGTQVFLDDLFSFRDKPEVLSGLL